MFSEGRYVYIISQWTIDARGREDDSEDEDESVLN